MFATFRRFRRHVAVLTALALLASVLVAAPALAADPEPDFGATFDACGDAPDAGFSDVPSAHANMGDIDCIAYYGVTQGTSATTYSPLQSVTREQMALFLTRLAGLVEIDVPDAGDSGFMDIGDLSTESQNAIGQLKALEITEGKSATSYAPGDNVTRAEMALFISRLMNQMTPMADGDIGLSSTTQYGHTPSDVADNDDDADIGSSYTDLGRATKNEYDAITQLYELGVASGISDTGYSPGTDITRAAMAAFMAGVLDHSNARPAGLSIQASLGEGWGTLAPTIVISVRDDSFRAVEDKAVDMFSSTSANNGLRKDGTCNFASNPDAVFAGDFIEGDCMWDDNDDVTDVDGNIILEGNVDAGDTRLFYAWIGEDDGDEFDTDDFTAQTVSVKAKPEQVSLKITSTINSKAAVDATEDQGQLVNLGAVSEVTFTAQLKDANGNDVARSGIEVSVEYRQGAEAEDDDRDLRSYVNTDEATLETDDNGQVSFTVEGPTDDRRDDVQSREDDIVFSSKGLDKAMDDVHWVETTPVLTSDSVDLRDYVLSGNPSVGATVRLYDQYGNPHRSDSNQKVEIKISPVLDDDNVDVVAVRGVISRGYARWSRTVTGAMAGTPVQVMYDIRHLTRNDDGDAVNENGDVVDSEDNSFEDTAGVPGNNPGALNDGIDLYIDATDRGDEVQVVTKAASTNAGDPELHVTVPGDGEFLTSTTDTVDPTLVYTYDSDDIFINSTAPLEGVEVDMAKFESLIGANLDEIETRAMIQVLAYDVDGTSIFRVNTEAMAPE
jgi:hypothetical protein